MHTDRPSAPSITALLEPVFDLAYARRQSALQGRTVEGDLREEIAGLIAEATANFDPKHWERKLAKRRAPSWLSGPTGAWASKRFPLVEGDPETSRANHVRARAAVYALSELTPRVDALVGQADDLRSRRLYVVEHGGNPNTDTSLKTCTRLVVDAFSQPALGFYADVWLAELRTYLPAPHLPPNDHPWLGRFYESVPGDPETSFANAVREAAATYIEDANLAIARQPQTWLSNIVDQINRKLLADRMAAETAAQLAAQATDHHQASA